MMSRPGDSENSILRGPDVQPPRPKDNTYWVIPNQLIAGGYPIDSFGDDSDAETSRQKLRGYLNHGVDCFIDLTHEGETDSYEMVLQEEAKKTQGHAVKYKRLPIQDFGIPTKEEMKRILDTIDKAIAAKKTVYVHCLGGIGRTGTTVGCFLARRNGNRGQEALDETNRLFQSSGRRYGTSPETMDQMSFVRDWKD